MPDDWEAALFAILEEDAGTPERVIILDDDRALTALIIAWPSIHVVRDPAALWPPGPGMPAWDALWSSVTFDILAVAAAIGRYPGEARSAIARARAAHLIYPDGTTCQHARAYLRAQVASRLPRPRRASEKPTKDSSETAAGA